MDRRRLRLCPGTGRLAALAAAAWLVAGAPATAQSSEPAYFSDRFELFFPEEPDPAAAPSPEQDLGEWTEPHRPAAPAPMPEPLAEPVAEPGGPTATAAAPDAVEPKTEAAAPEPAAPAASSPVPAPVPVPAAEGKAPAPTAEPAAPAPKVEAKPAPKAPVPRPKRKVAAAPKAAAPKPVISEPTPKPVVVPAPKPEPRPVAASPSPEPVAAKTEPVATPEPAAAEAPKPPVEAAPAGTSEPMNASSDLSAGVSAAAETPAVVVEPAPAPPPASIADRMGAVMRSSESLWLAAAVGLLSMGLLALQALAAGRARRRLEATFEGTRTYLEGQLDQQMKAQAEAYEGKIALMRDHVASARKHAAEVRRVAEAALAARAPSNGHAAPVGDESAARTLRDFLHGVAHELDGIVESINIAEAARGIFSDEAWDYGEDFPLPSLELHESTLEGTDHADLLPAIRNAYAALAPMNEQMRAGYKIAPASVQDALAQVETARDLVRAAARRGSSAAEPVDWEKAA